MSTPTVTAAKKFDAVADAHGLQKAMKGLGTDEKTLIDILVKRSVEQRVAIANVYKTQFGKDLISELKGELSGQLLNVMVALMTPLPAFYAKELHDAIEGLGTDDDTIIEILCSLNTYAIRTISEQYEKMYKTTLEKDLEGDTSGDFRRLCISLCQANRPQCDEINIRQAKADAQALYDAGEGKWGTDESTFNRILVTNSYEQLRQIFLEYTVLTGHDIEKAIKDEFSGSIQRGHLAIVKCVKSKLGFFAEKLYECMSGLGTTDKTLIRIVVSRCEIDLGDIKRAFAYKYGKTLESFISDDTSGDYKKVLLALL